MSEPTWKKLVAQLERKGHQSPYLDRLRDRLPTRVGANDLAAEILREMASSGSCASIVRRSASAGMTTSPRFTRSRRVAAPERSDPSKKWYVGKRPWPFAPCCADPFPC